jgi:hypothetical protein
MLEGGRLVRERQEVRGELVMSSEADGALRRVSVRVSNVSAAVDVAVDDKDSVIARSMIGCHVIAEAVDGEFISLLEPPPTAVDAASRCSQHRCFPVLAGPPGTRDILLVSPIILYDHPEIAEQSNTALFDCTEIDEILTLRVMTMTDEEKAQARATDPRAAQIIDQCDAMSPEAMARLPGSGDSGRRRLVGPVGRQCGSTRYRRCPGTRGANLAGQPCPVAAPAQRRRARHLRGRQDRPRHLGS